MPLRTIVRLVRLPLANRVETAIVLAQRGMLRPIRPDRLIQIGLTLHRWGSTPAAAFAVNAIARPDQAGIVDDELHETVRSASLDVRERILAHAEEGADDRVPTIDQLAERGSRTTPEAPDEEGRTVILTSGTTGAPKGARLGRPEGIDPLAWFLKVVPIDAGSAYLIPAPLFHAHGYGQLVLGSALGCTIVLPRRFDPEGTLALIERHRV